ncbi:ATP-binding protein [Nannocystaceae bacterium ST9]
MSDFVAQIEHHLRRVQSIEATEAVEADRPPDLSHHEATLVSLFEREAAPAARFSEWGTHVLSHFVDEMHWELLAGFAARLSWQSRRDHIDAAIAIAVDIDDPSFSSIEWPRRVRLEELARRVTRDVQATSGKYPWQIVSRYCEHLGLVGVRLGGPLVSLSGKTFLSLRGIDRVRWLIALEGVRGGGLGDAWCVGTAYVSLILQRAGYTFTIDNDEERTLLGWSGIARWSALGVLHEGEYGEHRIGYELTALGNDLFAAVNSDVLASFRSAALAQMEDDRSEVILSVGDVDRENQSTAAAMRQMRLVAHEVRNALLPIRHALDKVWMAVAQADLEESLAMPREQIEGGITRLYRFVETSVRMSSPIDDAITSFAVLDVIEEARRALSPEFRGSIRVETVPGAAGPKTRGHRGRAVLAIVNILRNAMQSGGPDVQISIVVDARDPDAIHLTVEDDGPGVPEPLRERIFDHGVSGRPDGAGHGLALVREVVERDFGGKVTCEGSVDGGARFHIELPAIQEGQ